MAYRKLHVTNADQCSCKHLANYCAVAHISALANALQTAVLLLV